LTAAIFHPESKTNEISWLREQDLIIGGRSKEQKLRTRPPHLLGLRGNVQEKKKKLIAD